MMASSATKKSPCQFLLTGIPGIGKTTLMSKIQDALKKQGINCSGFITEEIRSNGRRIGFDVVTLAGQRGQLARINDCADGPGASRRQYKVGQYSVNLMSFEQTALPVLHQIKGGNSSVCLVDEIGKMELFSQSFVQAVRKVISQPNVILVATIPVPKGRPIPFIEELRNGSQSLVFEVTRENRDSILNDIVAAIQVSLQVT